MYFTSKLGLTYSDACGSSVASHFNTSSRQLHTVYGLIVRGSCNETHRARAVRIVYKLPLDTSAENVLTRRGLDSLETTYFVQLTEVDFKCVKG